MERLRARISECSRAARASTRTRHTDHGLRLSSSVYGSIQGGRGTGIHGRCWASDFSQERGTNNGRPRRFPLPAIRLCLHRLSSYIIPKCAWRGQVASVTHTCRLESPASISAHALSVAKIFNILFHASIFQGGSVLARELSHRSLSALAVFSPCPFVLYYHVIIL